MPVSREKLYEEVWAEPATAVAARYKVSSNFLARVCRRLGVPVPPRGHWARLQAGKQGMPRPPLPAPRPGDESEWIPGGGFRAIPGLPDAAATSSAPVKARVHRRSPHVLVAAAKVHFAKLRASRGEYLKPAKRLVADLFVSQDAVERTFALANRLYLALEAKGHRVVIAPPGERLSRERIDQRDPPGGPEGYSPWEDRWSPFRPTVTYVGTVAVGLTVYELSELTEVEYRVRLGKFIRVSSIPVEERRKRAPWESANPHRDYMPSGRLGIHVFSPYGGTSWRRDWREARRGELSGKIDEIVSAVEGAAPQIAEGVRLERLRQEEAHRRWEIEEAARKKREEEERRERLEERRRQTREESREQLEEVVEGWRLACSMEEFFLKAAQAAAALPDEERQRVEARLKEARSLLGGTGVLEHFEAWEEPEEPEDEEEESPWVIRSRDDRE
ncbi:MAG: hypothetical protein QM765_39100 [Myxococcales bacterium]